MLRRCSTQPVLSPYPFVLRSPSRLIWYMPKRLKLSSAAPRLLSACRPSRIVGMRIFSISPFRYEAAVFMTHKNFRRMAAGAIPFG